jgi:hypothetical protein
MRVTTKVEKTFGKVVEALQQEKGSKGKMVAK